MARHISNLKFHISNSELPGSSSELPASRFKSEVANFEPPTRRRKFRIVTSRLPAFRSNTRGFTLVELMVVLVLLLILATMSMPILELAKVHAREAVLKDDLFTLRKLIDEFTLDKQRAPTSLDELVEAGYLRGGLPVDPFTGSNETWRTDEDEVPVNPGQTATGIVDVHSGADGIALDGTNYSSW